MSNFDEAFKKTMAHEGWGQLSNDPHDPGGMTYSGISRRYWPTWAGWAIIDDAERPFYPQVVEQFMALAKDFYLVNFWHRIQGDLIAEFSPAIAEELFDTAVNVGVVRAVEFLQEAFNVSMGEYEYGKDLVVDGRLGPVTIEAVRNYLHSRPGSDEMNQEILLNCMNGEQYIFYRDNPRRRKFRGWFTRV